MGHVAQDAAIHVSKIGGVHLSFLSLQTSNYSTQRRRGDKNDGRLKRLGSVVISSRNGVWGRPSRKRFWSLSCAILCDFTHPVVHLTAAWEWEIRGFLFTPLYWLVGLIFPFNFLGCRTTTWIFWGVRPDTHSGCATDVASWLAEDTPANQACSPGFAVSRRPVTWPSSWSKLHGHVVQAVPETGLVQPTPQGQWHTAAELWRRALWREHSGMGWRYRPRRLRVNDDDDECVDLHTGMTITATHVYAIAIICMVDHIEWHKT